MTPTFVLGPGARIGPYEILSELGRGGVGVVYRARDVKLRREVALKTLASVGDADATERFVREARAAARLKHPGIVQVLGVERAGAISVVALELVEGGSLARRIKDSGPLAPHAAAYLIRDLAHAVHAAHREGIVHRDLKPANVLLDRSGNPKLADFGMARDEKLTGITATGEVLGTPAYMAPEQAQGNQAAMGPTTDVYGLGGILYEALAGQPPFTGTSGLATLRRVLEEEPAPPSGPRARRGKAAVPRDLETICLKALEKRPERRYASADELARDLERFTQGEPVLARPIGGAERGWRWIRRRNRVASALAIALGVVAAASIRVALGQRREAEERRAAATREVDERRAAATRERQAAAVEIGSFETAARACPPDSGPRRTVVLRGVVMLGCAREAASVESTTEAFAVLLHADLAVAHHAVRFGEIGLATAVLDEASHLLWAGTAEDHARHHALSEHVTRRDEVLDLLTLAADCVRSDDLLPYAEELLTRALALDREYALPLTQRGSVRLARHDFEGARADCEHALALEPLSIEARIDLAHALVELGEGARATVEVERAVSQARTATTLLARGHVRARSGDRAGAVLDLRDVVTLQPGGPAAAEARSLLAELGAEPR